MKKDADAPPGKGGDEAGLREREALYRALIEMTGTGYVVLDMEGRVMDANTAYVRLSGHRELGEILGRSVAEWTADPEKENNLLEIKRCFKEGVTKNLEVSYIDRDHHIIPIDVNATAARIGGKLRSIALCRDITARRKAEEELLYFKKAVDSSSDAIGMSTPEGRHYYQNEAFTKLFGLTASQVDGAEGPPSTIYADEKAGKEVFATIMRGEPWIGQVKMKGGDNRLLDIWLRAYTIKDPSGKILGLVGLHTDITEHKRIERALRESESRYRALYMDSKDAIMLLSSDGFFIAGNPATVKMFGCRDEGEFAMLSVSRLSPEYQPEGVLSAAKEREMIKRAMETGAQFFEWTHVRKDGTEFPCTVLLSRIEGGQGPFLQSTVRDVTAQKKAEGELLKTMRDLAEANRHLHDSQSQLLQSEKMASLGQLAAGVAHEINNPMGFINSNLGTLGGYIETLKKLLALHERYLEVSRDGAGGEGEKILREIGELRKREDVSFILEDVDLLVNESLEGTRRVKEIVTGLKSFARLDEADIKEANLNEGIEATLKLIWNELKYKCEIRKKLGTLPPLRCHPGQLNQVFMNLLINASHAISEKGTITIETGVENGQIVIRIADTGAGIPEENLSKLFTPFFTTKPVGKGTGLGLSIAYGIVKKHHGDIQVESKAGKGTAFTIRLPLSGVADERG
ncbi:MAG: PAS domain S-box protein [Verrucomicrobiae bacterium]|nr:PAS domain S-box protein [Verrucomicrobiae bacterium]